MDLSIEQEYLIDDILNSGIKQISKSNLKDFSNNRNQKVYNYNITNNNNNNIKDNKREELKSLISTIKHRTDNNNNFNISDRSNTIIDSARLKNADNNYKLELKSLQQSIDRLEEKLCI